MGESDWLLRFLDPRKGCVCARCGGAKTHGDVLCPECSPWCPDPDGPGRSHRLGRRRKDPAQDACAGCMVWLENLDRSCGGYAEKCFRDSCRRFNLCQGNAPREFRSGFYVYRLEQGYIGMTFNPEHRAGDHARGAREGREIRKHWGNVGPPGRVRSGSRRVVWLSPLLDSRVEAFQVEWALKYLCRRGDPGFNRAMGLSQVPGVSWTSAEVLSRRGSRRLFCLLSWEPSGLVPYSLVSPALEYLLEQSDSVSGDVLCLREIPAGGTAPAPRSFPCCPCSLLPSASGP